MVRQKGSHKVYKHPKHAGLITVPDHGGNKAPSVGVLHDKESRLEIALLVTSR